FILSGRLIVNGLIRVAKFLNWREFVVGFLMMSLAASLPNLFVGVSSALKGIPELSFGDVVGGNVVDLTLVAALGILLSQGIRAESRMVQMSSFFTLGAAILPLILAADGEISRIDGLVLIFAFLFYGLWLFAKEERFTKVYRDHPDNNKSFLKNLLSLILGIALLVWASQGIVNSAIFFAEKLALPIGLVGILIVGLGNVLPETYFTVLSARKKQGWLILGDLMGSVITCATLVLGIVALIAPIKIADFSPYLLARAFLIISAIFFLVFLRTGKKLTRKEGLFLLGLYITFLLSEIFLR
ncbi:MAG: sodium:calcium antiporter, partial [Candidatus Nealsonbacteria bacterium]|nr:sodium:calcium antiporter [Candidatus Nealsonbacteria bacterium]